MQAIRETLNILIKEEKLAKGWVKACSETIKTALEITTVGNSVRTVIIERIH